MLIINAIHDALFKGDTGRFINECCHPDLQRSLVPNAAQARTPIPTLTPTLTPTFPLVTLSSPRRRGSRNATPRALKTPPPSIVVRDTIPAFAGMTPLPLKKGGREMGVGVRLCIDYGFYTQVICFDVRLSNRGNFVFNLS